MSSDKEQWGWDVREEKFREIGQELAKKFKHSTVCSDFKNG